MDTGRIEKFVDRQWEDEIVPQLIEYIRIPNKSPMFDADWVANGYMEQAVDLMTTWARAQNIPGMQLDVVRLDELARHDRRHGRFRRRSHRASRRRHRQRDSAAPVTPAAAAHSSNQTPSAHK